MITAGDNSRNGRRASEGAVEFFKAALSRAKSERAVALQLHLLGLYSQSFVWSVRAMEILFRDTLIAPRFVEQGQSVDGAIRSASRILGDSNWQRALVKLGEWYGPFDKALTEDQEDAWEVWASRIVRRRGDLIHGRLVNPATEEESVRVLQFVDRAATWFPQRLFISGKHLLSSAFREAIEDAVSEMQHGQA